MAMDRRSLLKALAVAPVTLLPSISSMASISTPDDNMVYIYLMGLFLMEFQGDNLILVTPQFRHHEFCILDADGIKPMPEYINFWDRLVPGSINTFQPANLKFPAKVIDPSGNYLLDPSNPGKHKHRCTMVLPKPSQIIVGDLEPSSNFHPNAGKIGDYIKSEATNRELGSITCFQYQARDNKPYYYGYFALHHPLTRHTVNAALRAARKACGKGFDLQMHDIPPTVSSGSIPNCPNFAQLKTLFDRRDASVTSNLHVDVASCPQFGIHG